MSEAVSPKNPRETGFIQYGDHYNIKCPFCDTNTSYITDGYSVPFRQCRVFAKKCPHCNNLVEYHASWEIKIRADHPLICKEETVSDGVLRRKESIEGTEVI